MFELILVIAALICFAMATFNTQPRSISLVPLGLFLLTIYLALPLLH